MTEKFPHADARKKKIASRAPSWIAPVLGGVVAAALTWGIGSTIFHGALVDQGLPEQVQSASDDERALWVRGGELADLAARANKLAELTDGSSAEALANLGASLAQGAALLGELQFEEQTPTALPQSYSPELVQELAQDVAKSSASLPALKKPSLQSTKLLSQIAFQTNLDANKAMDSLGEKNPPELAKPLSAVADQDQNQPVACLPDPNLLNADAEVKDSKNFESVTVARALDRGYALDYALQLQAARGVSSQSAAIEKKRTALSKQLASLRSAVDAKCEDLRQPAYALPKDGLKDLGNVVSDSTEDFDQALVLAAGSSDEGTGQRIAAVAFEVLDNEAKANPEHRILVSGASVN